MSNHSILFTPRLNHAIQVATKAHQGQFRKITHTPFISHPFSVMLIASPFTSQEDTLIAALFHDILEDVPANIYSESNMTKDFGTQVTNIVKDLSEVKQQDSQKLPWQQRKTSYLDHLRTVQNPETLLISLSDKIHNLSSILEEYQLLGEDLWPNFGGNKERQLWYHSSLLEIFQNKPLPASLLRKYQELVSSFNSIINT